MKTLLIIPAYNEQDNIKQTVNKIQEYGKLDYIVINDGSTAETQRFSVGIGSDYDYNMLKQFAGDEENMFQAGTAEELASRFKIITGLISSRSRSINPNEINSSPIIKKQQHTTSIKIESPIIEDDEDIFEF